MAKQKVKETYKGHQIDYEFDLDWHVKIDGSRFGSYMEPLSNAEREARKHIDKLIEEKKPSSQKR